MDEKALEEEIQAFGLNAPRLTPEAIDATISYTEFYRVANTTCIICSMVLSNGYVIIGKSAAASMDNFNEEIGQKIARDNARDQIWALEGYLLKDKLHNKTI